MLPKWKLSQDGKTASRQFDSGTMESRLISAISDAELADAWPADLPSIQEVRAAQMAALTATYATEIQQPVTYMGAVFQANDAGQTLISRVLACGSVPEGFFWLDAENTPVVMSYVQLQGLALTMLARGQSAFARLQQLKSQVRAAPTVNDVRAVVWS